MPRYIYPNKVQIYHCQNNTCTIFCILTCMQQLHASSQKQVKTFRPTIHAYRMHVCMYIILCSDDFLTICIRNTELTTKLFLHTVPQISSHQIIIALSRQHKVMLQLAWLSIASNIALYTCTTQQKCFVPMTVNITNHVSALHFSMVYQSIHYQDFTFRIEVAIGILLFMAIILHVSSLLLAIMYSY